VAEGRDQNGRFQRGHSQPGPGRPRLGVEREYLEVLASACSLDRWRKIVNRAVKDAVNGSAKAREWLGERLLGKLTENALSEAAADALDGVSAGDELELLRLDRRLRRGLFEEGRLRQLGRLEKRRARANGQATEAVLPNSDTPSTVLQDEVEGGGRAPEGGAPAAGPDAPEG
jgi:hypothetical protein